MADKTDNERLLAILSRLLLEHQAMRALLEEDGRGWRGSAAHHCGQLRVRQSIQDRLHELSDALQCSPASANTIPLLTKVLEQSIVLRGVMPL